MHHPNHRELMQIDLSMSSNYLSQIASQMLACQFIDSKLVNSFRSNLGQAQAAPRSDSQQNQSLLIDLAEVKDPLFHAMISCFGEAHISCNLLRFTLKPLHSQIRQSISSFAESCLRKAQLFFNRSFHVVRGGRCESSYLASSLFLEMSEQAVSFISSLDLLAQTYFHIYQAGLANQSHLAPYYQGLQDSLHLSSPKPEPLLFANDNGYTFELSYRIEQLVMRLQQMIDLMENTVEALLLTKLRLACDDLINAAQRIGSLQMPTTGHLRFWEGRRLQRIEAIAHFIERFDEFSELAEESFQLTQLQKDQAKTFLAPDSFRRSLTLALMEQGHNPEDALRAAEALVDYSSHQNVRISAIVAAELPKIHPILNEQTLQLLQEIDIDRQLAKKSGPEKQFVLDRSRKLMQAIQSKAHIISFFIITSLMGCGLKTDTTSKIEDFRPDIPYHAEPEAPPSKTSQPLEKTDRQTPTDDSVLSNKALDHEKDSTNDSPASHRKGKQNNN